MVVKFAQCAQFSALARIAARDARPAAVPCNDNLRIRPGGAAPRTIHRPVLVRRWYIAPNGALECRWSIAADGGEGDDGSRSPRIRRRRASRARVGRGGGGLAPCSFRYIV